MKIKKGRRNTCSQNNRHGIKINPNNTNKLKNLLTIFTIFTAFVTQVGCTLHTVTEQRGNACRSRMARRDASDTILYKYVSNGQTSVTDVLCNRK